MERTGTSIAGPAKYAAVLALCAVSLAGLAWAVLDRSPVPSPPPERTSGPSAPSGSVVSVPQETSAVGADAPSVVPVAPGASAARAGAPALGITNRIDLNTADQATLESLPGIGPALARRIIDDRTQHGLFDRVESLTRVKGIGPKTIEKLRALVRVSTPTPKGAPAAGQGNP